MDIICRLVNRLKKAKGTGDTRYEHDQACFQNEHVDK